MYKLQDNPTPDPAPEPPALPTPKTASDVFQPKRIELRCADLPARPLAIALLGIAALLAVLQLILPTGGWWHVFNAIVTFLLVVATGYAAWTLARTKNWAVRLTAHVETNAAPQPEPEEAVEPEPESESEPEPESEPEEKGPHWSDMPFPDPDVELFPPEPETEEHTATEPETAPHWSEKSFPDPDTATKA